LKKSHSALKAVHEYLTKHAVDAMLLTNLTAIERGFTSICDIEAKLIKAREGFAGAAGKKESVLTESKKIESDHENSVRNLIKHSLNLRA